MVIVKVGGGRGINLDGVASDVRSMPGPVVIVHGANAVRDELAAALGRETRVVTSASGYSSVYSDASMIELLMMAYAGLRNKQLVERLQQRGCNAIGLSGLDGRAVSGTRNRGIRVREGEKTLIVRDLSGKPAAANAALLRLLLDHGYTPVLTMPIADESGSAINADNDDVVAVLQAALDASHVVELIEAPGLLRDPSDPSSVIRSAAAEELRDLEEAATGRFKRKLHALRKLFEAASPIVVIADGRVEHPVADALAGMGTVITQGPGIGGQGPGARDEESCHATFDAEQRTVQTKEAGRQSGQPRPE